MKTRTKTQEREKKIGLRPVSTWCRVSSALTSNVQIFVINGWRTESNSPMVRKKLTRMIMRTEKLTRSNENTSGMNISSKTITERLWRIENSNVAFENTIIFLLNGKSIYLSKVFDA